MSANLMKVIGILVSDQDGINELYSNPEDFSEKHNLTEAEQVLLYSCCKPLLGSFFQSALMNYEPAVRWPGPHPKIAGLIPQNSDTGSKVLIKILGEGFLPKAGARLVKYGKDGSVTESITLKNLTGSDKVLLKEFKKQTFDQKMLIFAADLSEAKPGHYDVILENTSDPRLAEELKSLFSNYPFSDGLPPLTKAKAFEIF